MKAKRTQRQLDNVLRVVAMPNRDISDMEAAYRQLARRELPLGSFYGYLDKLKAEGLVRETQGRRSSRHTDMCHVKWQLTPAGRKKLKALEAASKTRKWQRSLG